MYLVENRRHDFIFECIKEGLTADQIDELLDERCKRGRRVQEKGCHSEEISKERIDKLPITEKVEHCALLKSQDRLQRDLRVTFNIDELRQFLGRQPSVRRMFVQVKSSQFWVDSFKAFFGRTEKEIANNLAYERLIVVNASDSQEVFEKNFFEQVKQIDLFWHLAP